MTLDLTSIDADNLNNSFLNTKRPNLTRIFDYLTGGVTNFEVDRVAAEKILMAFPMMRAWVRLGKAFIQTAVKQLYTEGFVQFLDLGSSIPTDEGIHAFAPAGNIIYTDINPVAVSYGNSLFSKLENVEYIYGDARNITAILQSDACRHLFQNEKKLAIGLNFLFLYFSPDQNRQFIQQLYKQVPYGSKIFHILYPRMAKQEDKGYNTFKQIIEHINPNFQLYTMSEYLDMMRPWKPVHMEPINTYLGLPENLYMTKDDPLALDVTAAFFEKV